MKKIKKNELGFITFEYPSQNLVGSNCSIESIGYNSLEVKQIEEILIPDDEYINDVFIRIKRNSLIEDISYMNFKKRFYPINNKNKESIKFQDIQNLKFSLFFKDSNNTHIENTVSLIIKIKFTIYYNLYNNITQQAHRN